PWQLTFEDSSEAWTTTVPASRSSATFTGLLRLMASMRASWSSAWKPWAASRDEGALNAATALAVRIPMIASAMSSSTTVKPWGARGSVVGAATAEDEYVTRPYTTMRNVCLARRSVRAPRSRGNAASGQEGFQVPGHLRELDEERVVAVG